MKQGSDEERALDVVKSKDLCFQAGVYNGCFSGLHNNKF